MLGPTRTVLHELGFKVTDTGQKKKKNRGCARRRHVVFAVLLDTTRQLTRLQKRLQNQNGFLEKLFTKNKFRFHDREDGHLRGFAAGSLLYIRFLCICGCLCCLPFFFFFFEAKEELLTDVPFKGEKEHPAVCSLCPSQQVDRYRLTVQPYKLHETRG